MPGNDEARQMFEAHYKRRWDKHEEFRREGEEYALPAVELGYRMYRAAWFDSRAATLKAAEAECLDVVNEHTSAGRTERMNGAEDCLDAVRALATPPAGA